MERSDVVDYRYLAINTSSSILISSTYILFLTKLQKGKPSEKDLPLMKNDTPIFISDSHAACTNSGESLFILMVLCPKYSD